MTKAPSTEQLAHVAALLSRGVGADANELARRAIALWKACDAEAQREARIGVLMTGAEINKDFVPKPPKGFPAPFKTFLKVIIHRNSEAQNIPVFKRFAIWLIRGQEAFHRNIAMSDVPVPPIEKAEAIIAEFKRKPMDECAWYSLGWSYQQWCAINASAHASKAARAPRKKKAA